MGNFTGETLFYLKAVLYNSHGFDQDSYLSNNYKFCTLFNLSQTQSSHACPAIPLLPWAIQWQTCTLNK